VETPSALRGPIARPAWLLSAAIVVASFALSITGTGIGVASLRYVAWLGYALALANLAFFRNPKRVPPPGERVVVSPADGRVVEVVELEDPDGFVGKAKRVAIFLSVLDVHVNRAPLAARVCAIRRKGSEFLAAFKADASERNVQLRMDLETASGARLAVVQITGLIARRIQCYAREGDGLERGQLYGLICYGSRVELYLPASADVRVRVGDRVRGGASAIGEVRA
jgi:phosphatidylserine decarboxylase